VGGSGSLKEDKARKSFQRHAKSEESTIKYALLAMKNSINQIAELIKLVTFLFHVTGHLDQFEMPHFSFVTISLITVEIAYH
jgi:hypothetical protein